MRLKTGQITNKLNAGNLFKYQGKCPGILLNGHGKSWNRHGKDMEKTWKFNSENPWPPWYMSLTLGGFNAL